MSSHPGLCTSDEDSTHDRCQQAKLKAAQGCTAFGARSLLGEAALAGAIQPSKGR